jgi:hypothetical protein
MVFTNSSSPFEYYLDILGSWAGNPILTSQWMCVFYLDSIKSINSNISSFLKSKESTLGSNGWDISNSTIKYLSDSRFQYSVDTLTGCVFCKQIQMVGEKVSASNQQLKYGGYQAPVTSNGRNSYTSFSASFYESNASFLDFIIRPWIISVGYNGLVARSQNSNKNVKCNLVDVIFLAKTGYLSPMAIRKIYRFYNVVPTSLIDDRYSYMKSALQITTVNFAFDGYTLLEGETPSQINR